MREALPIDAALPEVLAALKRDAAVVLEAPPGAGKTTRVPPALLEIVQGEVVVLEPRRIAARAAARWVASELGERVGERVGYQVRFEEVSSPRTRLRYLTEGILARRLLSDPELRGVGAVVLDEFHERHLPGDLALALVQRLLPRVKLVVMSATLDAAPLAKHLGCRVVRSEGRRFAVEIEYQEKPGRLGEQVALAVRKLTVPGSSGDVLVFLPGAAEIRQAAQACEEIARHRELLLVPLHGDLPAEEQDRALSPADRRKVILSTNVAETSVTVPGVTAVIDSGLARIAAHSPWSGLTSLQVMKVSRASAAQRAGRAGRTGPGRALRLYSKRDHDARPEHHPPEIERLDLAGTVLDLRAAGIDPAQLPWVDAPPPSSLGTAEALLRRIGALDDSGQITELGRDCARFPLHPRLSRLLLESARRGAAADGCTIAALLSENEARAADVLELLDQPRSRRAEQARSQLLRSLGRSDAGKDPDALRISTLSAFPDRIARRRGDEVLLSSGGSAQIVREGPRSEWLVAVDAEERREHGRSRVLVRLACAIDPEWLLEAAREETQLVWAHDRVEAVHRLLYDKLVLEETRTPAQDAALLFQHASFDRTRIEELRARAAAVAQHCPESGVRALSDEDVERALRRACEGRGSLVELQDLDLAGLLFQPAQRAALDRLAPEQVSLPSGRKLHVEYAASQPPAVRSRLQDFFGLARGPAICEGRLPLVLHLLAPNGRAQQVTQDLAGFWQRHYPSVRRELMRKYPRHAWPEDGATASPRARSR